MTDQPRTERLGGGDGPEVTIPDWDDEGPQDKQWVDWFLQQSYQAQMVIAGFSLDAEATAAHLIKAFMTAEQDLKDATIPPHIILIKLMVAYYRSSRRILVANGAIPAENDEQEPS